MNKKEIEENYQITFYNLNLYLFTNKKDFFED